MKPQLKTPIAVKSAPVQLEINNRLLADAMLFLRSTSGKRVQISSLRPGDRLSCSMRLVPPVYVVQNSVTHQKLEVHRGGPMEVLNYSQVRIEYDTVQKTGLFPWWRKLAVALGVFR